MRAPDPEIDTPGGGCLAMGFFCSLLPLTTNPHDGINLDGNSSRASVSRASNSGPIAEGSAIS